MSQYVPYLEALNRETGLDIQLSASGGAHMMLDGKGMLLQWLEEQGMFIVYMELGTLSGWRDEEVLRQLLSANFLFLQTEGGALSYNPAANMVGMNYAIPVYGLTAEDFVRRLDAVILLAEQWEERLRLMGAEQERLAAQAMAQEEQNSSSEEGLYAAMQMLRI